MPKEIEVIAAAAAALVALFAFVVSCIALWTTASVARAQLYLELRGRFAEINRDLPRGDPDYHDPTWRPTPTSHPEQFRHIEAYWYHAFDEWFTTKVLHPWRFKRLWQVFFERAILEGLKNVPIRYVLYHLMKNNLTSFSGRKDEFRTDLAAAYRRYTNADIFAEFQPPALGDTPPGPTRTSTSA